MHSHSFAVLEILIKTKLKGPARVATITDAPATRINHYAEGKKNTGMCQNHK
jgi:hypothetical protein